MAREPASIRYKNPGAMWGSALAIKWGADKHAVTLNDGKGQNNNIAVFPTYVQGICAQLDLWRSSPRYKNKPFKDAIRVWSGGNSVEQYIAYVCKRVPGMTRDTVMNDAFWQSPEGLGFLKAQAGHEAGKVYPAPANDWVEAQKIVFSGKVIHPPAPAAVHKDPVIPTVTTAVTTTAAHTAGFPIGWTIAVGILTLGAFVVWRVWKNYRALADYQDQIEKLSAVVEPAPAPVTDV